MNVPAASVRSDGDAHGISVFFGLSGGEEPELEFGREDEAGCVTLKLTTFAAG